MFEVFPGQNLSRKEIGNRAEVEVVGLETHSSTEYWTGHW
jgi:hypothetical protein